MLPTDPRYKELTSEQIELLFVNFLTNPTPEEHRAYLLRQKAEAGRADSIPVEELRKMGYADAQIEAIREDVRTCQGTLG